MVCRVLRPNAYSLVLTCHALRLTTFAAAKKANVQTELGLPFLSTQGRVEGYGFEQAVVGQRHELANEVPRHAHRVAPTTPFRLQSTIQLGATLKKGKGAV